MTSSSRGDRLRSLERFFDQWRMAHAPMIEPPLEPRLEQLLAQLKPLLGTAQQQAVPAFPAVRPLRPEALAPLLAQLSGALRIAREEGGLLNVWSVAGLRRDEVRNAGVLAALFNSQVSGDRARAFLSAFVDRVRGQERHRLPSAAQIESGYSVQTETCPLGADDDRVDLSIEGRDFILLIEVKIDAAEGVEQLARYDTVLRLKAETLGKTAALIYLSPTPAKAPPAHTFYADWRDVRRAAHAVALRKSAGPRSLQDRLLAQFAEHVRQF